MAPPPQSLVSASSLGVPRNQVVSQPTISSSNSSNITKATQGGKKIKQYGGITVQANTMPPTSWSKSAVSPGENSNNLQQTGVQAKLNATNDNGAYSPSGTGWNTPGMFSTPNTSGGGRRRKTRKSRKSRKTRKSRKSRKHKRRNTYKK